MQLFVVVVVVVVVVADFLALTHGQLYWVWLYWVWPKWEFLKLKRIEMFLHIIEITKLQNSVSDIFVSQCNPTIKDLHWNVTHL